MLEGVVANIYAKARVQPPIGVLGLAKACELKLRAQVGCSEGLVDDEIRYDSRMSDEWKRTHVARCIAVWALQWNCVPQTPDAVQYVARALIRNADALSLPRPSMRSRGA